MRDPQGLGRQENGAESLHPAAEKRPGNGLCQDGKSASEQGMNPPQLVGTR
jgi:hypothetical protein